LALGSGCRATSHVVKLSQPHTQTAAHHVERLEAAYVDGDGRLVLQAHGRLAGESKCATLTIARPAPPEAGHSGQERVVMTSAAVQAGWQPDAALRSVPIGSTLMFDKYSSYQWSRLRPDAGRSEEVRFVRRNGDEQRWELLYAQIDEATGQCLFTVFEVQSEQKIVRYSAALALLPFATALDAVAVGTTMTGTVAMIAAGTAMYGPPRIP